MDLADLEAVINDEFADPIARQGALDEWSLRAQEQHQEAVRHAGHDGRQSADTNDSGEKDKKNKKSKTDDSTQS